METKYIAFLDILGFKDLIENNEINVLDKLYDELQESLMHCFSFANAEHLMKENKDEDAGIEENNLNSLIISDSIIIWTDDDSQRSFVNLIFTIRYLLYRSILSGFPLRGGLSCGELIVKSGSHAQSPKINSYSTILGKGLTRAYLIENVSEWSGCTIDEKCIDHFNSKLESESEDTADLSFLEEMDFVKTYKVPFKSGEIKKCVTINWTHIGVGALDSKKIRESFSKHNKKVTDWSVENKIRNTLKFFNSAKKNKNVT